MESSSTEKNSTDSQNFKIVNPGNKITIVKLDEDYFLLLKLQVTTALRGHGLMNHVNEETEAPSKFITNGDLKVPNPEYDQWVRQDSLITAWLLGAMSNSLLSEILDCETAREVWKTLNA